MPIFLFAAAGACLGLGVGATKYLSDKARRRAAYELKTQEYREGADLLREQIDYELMRKEAIAVGVDPDAVEAGYLAMVQGQVSVADATDMLRRLVGNPA
ncbi:MAG: hypothetical protein WCP28_08040 [Actinomycetes bacterium]